MHILSGVLQILCPVSIPQHGQHHTCRNMSDIAKEILDIQFGPTLRLILNL